MYLINLDIALLHVSNGGGCVQQLHHDALFDFQITSCPDLAMNEDDIFRQRLPGNEVITLWHIIKKHFCKIGRGASDRAMNLGNARCQIGFLLLRQSASCSGDNVSGHAKLLRQKRSTSIGYGYNERPAS